jgi:hypothetical protein
MRIVDQIHRETPQEKMKRLTIEGDMTHIVLHEIIDLLYNKARFH